MYKLELAGGETCSRAGVVEVVLMDHLSQHDLSENSAYTRRNYNMGVRDGLMKASRS